MYSEKYIKISKKYWGESTKLNQRLEGNLYTALIFLSLGELFGLKEAKYLWHQYCWLWAKIHKMILIIWHKLIFLILKSIMNINNNIDVYIKIYIYK